jgi:hypothetical protein
MKQHPRPARSQHNRHGASGSGDRVEVGRRLAYCFASQFTGSIALEKNIVSVTASGAGATLLASIVFTHQHSDIEAYQRANIGRQGVVGCCDQDMIDSTRQGNNNLLDALVERTGLGIQLLQQFHLFLGTTTIDRVARGVQSLCRTIRQGNLTATRLSLFYDGTRIVDCLGYGISLKIIAIGKTGLFFGHRANAYTLFYIETTLAQDTVIHDPGLLLAGLEVKITRVDELPLQGIQESAKAIDSQFTRFEDILTNRFKY